MGQLRRPAYRRPNVVLLAAAASVAVVLFGSLALQPVNSAFSGTTRNPGNTWTAAAGCAAGSVTVNPSADSYVASTSTGSNYGGMSFFEVGNDSGNVTRALINFTLPTIPAGCTMSAATLKLTVYLAGTAGRTYQVYRSAAAWVAGTVTYTNQPATTGTAVTATSVASGTISWNVLTPVQALYSGANNGFVIKDANEATSAPSIYTSSEGTAADQPQLTVTYA
jgi:hypothetical protein